MDQIRYVMLKLSFDAPLAKMSNDYFPVFPNKKINIVQGQAIVKF